MQDTDKLNMICAKTFRRSFFTSLAKGEDVNHVFSAFKDLFINDGDARVRDIFDFFFNFLRKNYRNEYVYKTAIVNKIIFGRHSPKTSSSAIELPVNNSIVDVAIFNGNSTAYEIKTEFDSPKRLVTQTIDYLDVFDKVYIVTHPKLADKYCSLNIKNVGVISLSNKETLSVVKEAESNSENLKLEKLFNVLRMDEYIKIIEDYASSKLDMPNGIIYNYCKDIYLSMPLNLANAYFVNAMKKRAIDKDLIDYLYSLPACLRVLGYATPLSKKQKDYIINLMDKEIRFC
ncbi:sce7726 family protein [Yersinia enterocolitica]|nr:sce7726 family protein [Yersinia enterocolitica]EKN5113953.1 hypothetical protein [Yersinia enterocolitica]EKN6055487.1 hypothetical protein [Yersinia enterocolitica]EKN6228041.1 hypothetical protein [Yersinia enterocolitica]ELZ4048453.1 sce7726 family protein [Yersinia enterocolitica]